MPGAVCPGRVHLWYRETDLPLTLEDLAERQLQEVCATELGLSGSFRFLDVYNPSSELAQEDIAERLRCGQSVFVQIEVDGKKQQYRNIRKVEKRAETNIHSRKEAIKLYESSIFRAMIEWIDNHIEATRLNHHRNMKRCVVLLLDMKEHHYKSMVRA